MQKRKISQAIQKGKAENNRTNGIFGLRNFVFSTTRISALKIHRLERGGFTGEGSASEFASIKSMGMLLFASMKTGPSPYLTVLKCYKTAGSNQWLKPPGLSWSCLFTTPCYFPWRTLRVFARCILSWCHFWCLEWITSFSLYSLTWVLDFHFTSQTCDTTGARSMSDFIRTSDEILRIVRVDTSHLPSFVLHFCVCLQPCFFLLVPVVFKCIHSFDFLRDISPWQCCT